MWEKMKANSQKFIAGMKNPRSSRAVYITVITLLLATAILITATAISNRAKREREKSADPTPEATATPTAKQENPREKDLQKDDTASTSTPTPAPEASPSPEEHQSSTATELPSLSLPVNGVLSKGYDATVQVFSATMGDYRIHLGLDLVTAENAPVCAAAAGTVSRIWEDPMMGVCVALSHEGDVYTIYKNLARELAEGIAVGSTVSAGQEIGTVGDSAAMELAEEPHLHLEMTVKGLSVDPLEYFSEEAKAAMAKDASFEAEENGNVPVSQPET